MATNKSVKFYKNTSFAAGTNYVEGGIYFESGTGLIKVGTGTTTPQVFGGKVSNAIWNEENKTLTLKYNDGTADKVLNFSDVASASGMQTALNGKQDTLTPGENIEIADNTISAIMDFSALNVTNNKSDVVNGVAVTVDQSNGVVKKPVVSITLGSVEDGNDNVVTGGAVRTAINNAVAGIAGAMHFRGSVTSVDNVADPVAGDVVLIGTKEYIYGGSPAAWHELGDEGVAGTLVNGLRDTEIASDSEDKFVAVALDGTVGAPTIAVTVSDVPMANVTGLTTALDGKQASLSTTQLAAVNSGITATKVATYDGYAATINGKVTANGAITGATKCKITYDSKGLVTAGADLTATDIPMIPISKVDGLQTALDSKDLMWEQFA